MSKKISKQEANYREADSNKRCGNCDMFVPPLRKLGIYDGNCTLVRGVIFADDVCDHWEKKK